MYFISSVCEMLMRLPNAWSALIVAARAQQVGHLDRLGMVHDHALHKSMSALDGTRGGIAASDGESMRAS